MSEEIKKVEGENQQSLPDQDKPSQDQTTTEEQTTEQTADDKIKALEEKFKKEISGLNRKNSELEKEKRELERAKLSEEEKLLAEKEDLKAEIESLEVVKKAAIVAQNLFKAGLPAELTERVKGETEEEIIADIQELETFINQEAEKRAEKIINSRLGGEAPKAGSNADLNSLQAAYNKAKENRDQTGMIAAKRQASLQGVDIID